MVSIWLGRRFGSWDASVFHVPFYEKHASHSFGIVSLHLPSVTLLTFNSVQLSLRNLGRARMEMDTLLALEALAIHQGIFEENVQALRLGGASALPPTPFKLTIKRKFLEQSIFRSADTKSALTYNAVHHQACIVSKSLGWKRKFSITISLYDCLPCFRFSAAII